ncbi:GL10660 [Drosophila persimilis]|uniref:GL10660 n=1 Tax=Drosophila persimilis TaxID=7234 RepID=B4GAR9_DROPE|nr:GL10660 [Drosophila persimilis]
MRAKHNLFKLIWMLFFISEVNAALYQRLNGYKPFLYNITLDACKLLNNRKSNPVANYLFGIFEKSSNLNHSCPYHHDLIVDQLATNVIDHHVSAVLPFPEGDYLLESHWFIDNIERAVFKVYGTLS